MLKKGTLFVMLAVLVFLFSGCETVKGIANGAAEGAKSDWQSLQKVDEQQRKNLW